MFPSSPHLVPATRRDKTRQHVNQSSQSRSASFRKKHTELGCHRHDLKLERTQFRNADRLVGHSDQYDAMIISIVVLYDTYLVGLFVRFSFPLSFSSVVNHLRCSRVFGTQDGDYLSTSIIYRFLYSSDMCSCRILSTALPHPCETRPRSETFY